MKQAGARSCAFVVTCEHGGNLIPAAYRHIFANEHEALESHRGYDPGALLMAREMARALHAKLFHSKVSRLLVDLNRSLSHRRLHGEMVRRLPEKTRQQIRERYYRPFRTIVEAEIARLIASGRPVLHVSSHSFTPVLDGRVRDVDIGLLYEPARPGEKGIANRWQAALKDRSPTLRVRRNYPYRGKSDGHTAGLRRRFGPGDYLGLELEINQRFVLAGGAEWKSLRAAVLTALLDAVAVRP